MGSTGEFFSLDMKTSRQIIQMAAEFPREGIKAYAGTSRMDIDECVELANYADECGLDGVMIISPWYFRLTDEGIYTFYSQIARRTAAKIFIYNFGAHRLFRLAGGLFTTRQRVPKHCRS